jgi:HlyD family secretion protein
MKRRLLMRVAVVIVALLAVAGGVRSAMHQFRPAAREMTTARVKRGNLELKVYSTGELRAVKSVTLMAPPVSGSLQIMRLARTGARVKAGEVVIEFDPSEQEYKLEQSKSEVAEADQQIAKSKADTAVQVAQDQAGLLSAKFDVRRAELEVSRNELLSAIDAQKNVLALDEARRRLAQLEQDINSRAESNRASLAVLQEKRNKSLLTMKQAQKAIDDMKVKTNLDGVVSVKDNPDAMGGMMFTGMILPEYREGDMVRPGRIVAEVLQVETMEIQARIDENDRANIKVGQPAQVQVDALPGQTYSGKVKTLAGLASRTWWRPDTARRFDATFQLDQPDSRLRAGQTAKVLIQGDQVKDALFLPRQVVFEKDGKPVLYVKNGSQFEAREVKITHRTESQITVEGLKEDDEVSLVDPEKAGSQPGKNGAAAPTIGGSR